MDDILILLLTVGLTVFAAINQSKKKKKSLPAEGEQSNFWETLMQEEPIVYDDDETMAPSPVRYQEGANKLHTPPSGIFTSMNQASSPYFNPEFDDNISTTKKRVEPAIHKQEIIPEEEDEMQPILQNFNLRDAVIFSEIINPKYF